jgi:hypothetical protein
MTGGSTVQGQRPTRRQKEAIEAARLKPDNWLVLKNPTGQLIIQHKETGKEKTITL